MSHRIRVTRRRWGGALAALAVVAGALTISSPALAAAPTANAGGPYSGAEGASVAVRGSATGGDGPLTYHWSSARASGGEQDGAVCAFANASALSTTVSCNDDGTFDLFLTVDDGVNPAVTSTAARLALSNVAPKVTITGATTPAGISDPVTVTATYADPGPVDSHRYVIDWGDGTTSRASTTEGLDGTGKVSGTTSYSTAGTRNITVTVFDSHGASGSDTATVSVVAGQPCARVSGKGRLPHHRRGSGFSFSVACGSAGPVGRTLVWLARHGTLRSGSVSLLRGSGRTATWSGTGKWQRSGRKTWARGYHYVIKATDNGRRRDWMNVTVRKPTGVVVLHARGLIPRGNITVRN